MSAAVRQALADAANAVAEFNCSPYFRAATKPGSAHVRLDRIEYPNRFGGICYWQVVVILPQDMTSAEKYIDEHIPALRSALADELVVTSVTPQQIVFDGPALPCVFIEGWREEETG